MGSLDKLICFLHRLEQSSIQYRLEGVRDAIMVTVAVPGERWEIEFFDSGRVEIERFESTGVVEEEKMLEDLLSIHAS
jgi:hypothetical protein